jgi:hypothetical protein
MAQDLQTTGPANSLKALGSLVSDKPRLARLIDDFQPGIEQRMPTPDERNDLAALVPHLEAALAPAERPEIRRMIAKLALGFPNANKGSVDETEARLELYAMALNDVPADVLGFACVEALKQCTFFPTPAELRKLCKDPHRRAFRLTRAKHLIAKHDREYRPPVEDRPLTDVERDELEAIMRRLDAAA